MLVTCLKCKKPVFVSSSLVMAGEAQVPCNACGAALVVTPTGSVRVNEPQGAVAEAAVPAPPVGVGSAGQSESISAGSGVWTPGGAPVPPAAVHAAPAPMPAAAQPVPAAAQPMPAMSFAALPQAQPASPAPAPMRAPLPPGAAHPQVHAAPAPMPIPVAPMPVAAPAPVSRPTPIVAAPAQAPAAAAPWGAMPITPPAEPQQAPEPVGALEEVMPASIPPQAIWSGQNPAPPAFSSPPEYQGEPAYDGPMSPALRPPIETPTPSGRYAPLPSAYAPAAAPAPAPAAAPGAREEPVMLQAPRRNTGPVPAYDQAAMAPPADWNVVEQRPAVAAARAAAGNATAFRDENWRVTAPKPGAFAHTAPLQVDSSEGIDAMEAEGWPEPRRRGVLPLLAGLVVVVTAGALWAAGIVSVPGMPVPAGLKAVFARLDEPRPAPGPAAPVAEPSEATAVDRAAEGDNSAAEEPADADTGKTGRKGQTPKHREPKPAGKGGRGLRPAPEPDEPPERPSPPVRAGKTPPAEDPSALARVSKPAPPPPPAPAPEPNGADAAEAHFKQGNSFMKEKKVSLAIEEYKRCLTTDPRNGKAYRALGVAHMLLGQEKSAIEAYERFVDLDPGHKDADKVRQIITDYRKRNPR